MAPPVIREYLGKNVDYFAAVGALATAYCVFKLLRSLWNGLSVFVLARALGLGVNLRRMGSWAVVTGSTDGIGKAYAFELAQRGINIFLLSRSADKLTVTASEIEWKYKVQTKTLAVDFTGGPDIYDVIRDQLAGLDIGILVNNVGMAYEFPEFFNLLDDKKIRDIITCNISSVTFMTRLVLTGMTERRKGVIINVASSAGTSPIPLMTVYSATKAYVDFFSRALQAEYKTKGITVQSVRPMFVSTKLSKMRHSSVFVPTPESYVRAAIATIGVESYTFGCMSHALQDKLMGLVPSSLRERLTVSSMMAVRKKALKKAEKRE